MLSALCALRYALCPLRTRYFCLVGFGQTLTRISHSPTGA